METTKWKLIIYRWFDEDLPKLPLAGSIKRIACNGPDSKTDRGRMR
jgi:hypothetical protein